MAWVDASGAGAGLPPIPSRQELEAAGIRIALGLPMERQITELAFRFLWETARQGWPLINNEERGGIGYGRTDANRERIARAFLESDYTHLAMLDTDHTHPWDTINRLARWFLVKQGNGQPPADVVYGMHYRRGEPYEPMMFLDVDDVGLFGCIPEDEAPLGLLQVDAAAHGSMVIARHVLEALPEPWWAYDYSTPEKESWPSEDIYFCRKVRQAGFTQAVDTTQTSPHMTIGLIDASTFREFRADHPNISKPLEEQIADAKAKLVQETAAD